MTLLPPTDEEPRTAGAGPEGRAATPLLSDREIRQARVPPGAHKVLIRKALFCVRARAGELDLLTGYWRVGLGRIV